MDPENSVGQRYWGGCGVLIFFLSHQSMNYFKKQLDPRGPIASGGGSVPVFLRKPTATCDFPGGGGGGPPVPGPLWIRPCHVPPLKKKSKFKLVLARCIDQKTKMSRDMRFPTMWYVHTRSLIRAFASCLNIL